MTNINVEAIGLVALAMFWCALVFKSTKCCRVCGKPEKECICTAPFH
ncbi:hypothetical protein [Aeromonas phage PZL-Ah152]|uniref:FeoB-associated Cys-rich membrane protein n=2 Tax=Armandvirus TaxID=3424952 RepID=A0AAE9BMN7_9CAUD|nr:hypothetical protein [Aeromonas phage PZL-Ah152]UAT28108.1 hypothetical protein [Aeromonas phage PZL-Ah8]